MKLTTKAAILAFALLAVSPAYSAGSPPPLVEMSTTVAVMTEHESVMSGQVTDPAGKPIHGVMVRLGDDGMGMAESVFTDAQGKYTLKTGLSGNLYLRLRTPYYRDYREVVTLSADAPLQKNLIMEPMVDAEEISDSLPAAYHFATLDFDTDDNADFSRTMFQRDCLSCHQLGNDYTRAPRSKDVWTGIVTRMNVYVGNFDMENLARRVDILTKGFGEDYKPLTVRPVFPLDKALNNTKIYEYRLGTGYMPHDTIYNPNDGLLYTGDQGIDYVSVTDMASGKTEYVFHADGLATLYRAGTDDDGQQLFKEFPAGTKHGPHSFALGLDNKYYITNGSKSIGVFDPKTRRFEASHLIPEKYGVNYPHTIRTDHQGMLWFTITASEQVGRLDPTTGEFTVLDLPTLKPLGNFNSSTWAYGIDVHPIDGSIWYSRLFGDKIGRIDPKTLKITEYDSPMGGPRRLHFDKKGVLWVTGYTEGTLARIDVLDGFKSKVYRLPEFAEGYRPAAYALGVHPDTQDIWINESMTDRIYRFIPSEERFIVYPMPLRGTFTRDMTFTADGKVCTANNPLPPMAVEGGVLEIICIDPNYQR